MFPVSVGPRLGELLTLHLAHITHVLRRIIPAAVFQVPWFLVFLPVFPKITFVRNAWAKRSRSNPFLPLAMVRKAVLDVALQVITVSAHFARAFFRIACNWQATQGILTVALHSSHQTAGPLGAVISSMLL